MTDDIGDGKPVEAQVSAAFDLREKLNQSVTILLFTHGGGPVVVFDAAVVSFK